jgi:HEPN domain-containing protein
MPVPKKGTAQYLLWLWIAENEDLFMAKLALKEEQGIGSAFFHLQQCAEKALKAFYCYFNTSEGYWFMSVFVMLNLFQHPSYRCNCI